jgi:hypothetical protein
MHPLPEALNLVCSNGRVEALLGQVKETKEPVSATSGGQEMKRKKCELFSPDRLKNFDLLTHEGGGAGDRLPLTQYSFHVQVVVVSTATISLLEGEFRSSSDFSQVRVESKKIEAKE